MISIIYAMVMAPSAAVGTTGLERVLLIFLMKYQPIKLQRTKPSLAKRSIQQSIGQNLHRNSRSQHEPPTSPLKLSIHRLKTQTNGKNLDLPIETRTNGEELQLTEQKLKQSVKNFNSPNKNSNKR